MSQQQPPGQPPYPPGGGYPGGGYSGGGPPGGGYPGGPPGGGYPGGGHPGGGYPGAPPGGGYPGAPPPPGGGVPPYGYPGGAYPPPPPKRPPIPIRRRGQIEQRGSAAAAALSFFTCGIYYLYWLHATGRELQETIEDPEIKPGIDVLLTIVTCGLWSIYVLYRNAQKIHGALLSVDPYAKDQSELTLILGVASVFTGTLTWVGAVYVLQEELNKLGRY